MTCQGASEAEKLQCIGEIDEEKGCEIRDVEG